jgi:hypothetical protein
LRDLRELAERRRTGLRNAVASIKSTFIRTPPYGGVRVCVPVCGATSWTPERRARQAKLIGNWKPWKRSTGPRSTEGKTRVSRNAYKGGARVLLLELARQLRDVLG